MNKCERARVSDMTKEQRGLDLLQEAINLISKKSSDILHLSKEEGAYLNIDWVDFKVDENTSVVVKIYRRNKS